MNKNSIAAVAAASVAALAGLSIDDKPEEAGLSEYQGRCAHALAHFITQIPAIEQGRYTVTFGETFRPQSVAMAYARQGVGIANSLHTKRLAVDLNLFDRGRFVESSEGHKPLADLWLQIGPHFGIKPAAGYYFNDGNHYSCQWQGVK